MGHSPRDTTPADYLGYLERSVLTIQVPVASCSSEREGGSLSLRGVVLSVESPLKLCTHRWLVKLHPLSLKSGPSYPAPSAPRVSTPVAYLMYLQSTTGVFFLILDMSGKIVVLLHEDPLMTHRPVEGLRIAVGLSTGSSPLMIILLGKARTLLTDDILDRIDSDILEQYFPVLQDLDIPFVIPKGSFKELSIDPVWAVREFSFSEIYSYLFDAHRVMILG